MSQMKQSGHALGAIGLGGAVATVLFFYWKLNYPESHAEVDEVTRGAITTIVIFAVTRVWSLAALLVGMLGVKPTRPQGGFARSGMLASLLLVSLVVLSGCGSATPRQSAEAAFLSVDTALEGFAIGIARAYLKCEEAANQTPAEEQLCYRKHQARVDQLNEATLYFRAYGETLIDLSSIPEQGPLVLARTALANLLPAVEEHMDPTYGQAIAWVEGAPL